MRSGRCLTSQPSRKPETTEQKASKESSLIWPEHLSVWIPKCFRFCETNRATCRFYASSTYSSTRACSLSESHQAFHTSVATHHREYSSAPGSVGLYPSNDHSEGTRMSLGFAHAVPAVLRSSRGSPASPFAAPVNNLCGTRRGASICDTGSSGPVVCGQVRPWSLEKKGPFVRTSVVELPEGTSIHSHCSSGALAPPGGVHARTPC